MTDRLRLQLCWECDSKASLSMTRMLLLLVADWDFFLLFSTSVAANLEASYCKRFFQLSHSNCQGHNSKYLARVTQAHSTVLQLALLRLTCVLQVLLMVIQHLCSSLNSGLLLLQSVSLWQSLIALIKCEDAVIGLVEVQLGCILSPELTAPLPLPYGPWCWDFFLHLIHILALCFMCEDVAYKTNRNVGYRLQLKQEMAR